MLNLKRNTIVEDKGFNNVIINDFFDGFLYVKTQEELDNWMALVKRVAYFGTYKNKTILDLLEERNYTDGVLAREFVSALKRAYKK
jgi:hypothetical protein